MRMTRNEMIQALYDNRISDELDAFYWYHGSHQEYDRKTVLEWIGHNS